MYQAFAAVYDRLMDDVDYDRWAAHITRLLLLRGVSPGARVCECACGTGELTLRLFHKGFRVTGVDLSPDMLNIARRKAAQAGLDIPFVCQDMRKLSLLRAQDAILCTCDGLNYIQSPGAFFRAAAKNLRAGGALICDLSTPFKYAGVLSRAAQTRITDEISYIWETASREKSADMRLTIFVKTPSGLYERIEETQRHYLHTMEALAQALQKAGFARARFTGGFTLKGAKETDQRWHLTAIKGE